MNGASTSKGDITGTYASAAQRSSTSKGDITGAYAAVAQRFGVYCGAGDNGLNGAASGDSTGAGDIAADPFVPGPFRGTGSDGTKAAAVGESTIVVVVLLSLHALRVLRRSVGCIWVAALALVVIVRRASSSSGGLVAIASSAFIMGSGSLGPEGLSLRTLGVPLASSEHMPLQVGLSFASPASSSSDECGGASISRLPGWPIVRWTDSAWKVILCCPSRRKSRRMCPTHLRRLARILFTRLKLVESARASSRIDFPVMRDSIRLLAPFICLCTFSVRVHVSDP